MSHALLFGSQMFPKLSTILVSCSLLTSLDSWFCFRILHWVGQVLQAPDFTQLSHWLGKVRAGRHQAAQKTYVTQTLKWTKACQRWTESIFTSMEAGVSHLKTSNIPTRGRTRPRTMTNSEPHQVGRWEVQMPMVQIYRSKVVSAISGFAQKLFGLCK